MSDKKELDLEYRKNGRFEKRDSDRLSLKAVRQASGDKQYSDFTTRAMTYVVPGHLMQERQDKARSGSASKKKQGIWLAVCEIRASDPNMDADAVWKNLDGRDVEGRWTLELDEDTVYQYRLGTDETKSIKYSTFVRHYYKEALRNSRQ
jgi:hypothetical protein